LRALRVLILFLILSLSFSACKKNSKDPNEDLFLLFLIYSVLNPPDVVCGDPAGTPSDPLFSSQWHLSNNGSTSGSVSGEDAKVTNPWNSGCKGGGVNVVTVDDGMDTNHEDLTPNYNPNLNRDFTFRNIFYTTGSCTTALGCHGTAVSGVMAARDGNATGVSGAAPRATLGARNVLYNSTDSNTSDAMSFNASLVYVSNNSWGATDDIGLLAASGTLWQAGIDTALSTGRNQKGSVFFWAAGNGGRAFSAAGRTNIYTDDSNFDGQANYYGVNAICAIGNDGKRALYSETGANLLVCAHSLGNNTTGIVTTDITSSGGYNRGTSSSEPANTNYTNSFSGTSSASPLAAGVSALVLDANPSLTWRDVRVILARSGRQVDTGDSGWFTNGGGLKFNHKYGFGAIDADAAVTLAKSWTNLSSEIVKTISPSVTSSSITDNNTTPTSNTIAVANTGIQKIEFVDLTLTVSTGSTDDPGDLQIELVSPSGKTAILAFPRVCFSQSGSTYINSRCNNFSSWRFGVTTFMDESADGNWTLKISDLCTQTGNTRTCSNWGGQSYTSAATGITNNGNQTISSIGLKIRGRAN
jgi:kexin